MIKICFTSGTNLYDFFLIPTIRINTAYFGLFVTIEWLKWYIGFRMYNDTEDSK